MAGCFQTYEIAENGGEGPQDHNCPIVCATVEYSREGLIELVRGCIFIQGVEGIIES